MKKTSKIFGAVALSAALAMGTAVPAFAATSPADAGTDGKAQTYEQKKGDTDWVDPHTDVALKVTTTQINCTLPLKMQVVADLDGGLITFPTPAKYQILNNNEKSPLYINDIKGELKSGWENAQSVVDLTNPSISASTTNNARVYMEVKGSGDKATNKVVLAGLTATNTAEEKGLPWIVEKAPQAGQNTPYSLTLAGATSTIKNLTTDSAATDLITITYTVSAAPAADVTVDGTVMADAEKGTNVA